MKGDPFGLSHEPTDQELVDRLMHNAKLDGLKPKEVARVYGFIKKKGWNRRRLDWVKQRMNDKVHDIVNWLVGNSDLGLITPASDNLIYFPHSHGTGKMSRERNKKASR